MVVNIEDWMTIMCRIRRGLQGKQQIYFNKYIKDFLSSIYIYTYFRYPFICMYVFQISLSTFTMFYLNYIPVWKRVLIASLILYRAITIHHRKLLLWNNDDTRFLIYVFTASPSSVLLIPVTKQSRSNMFRWYTLYIPSQVQRYIHTYMILPGNVSSR